MTYYPHGRLIDVDFKDLYEDKCIESSSLYGFGLCDECGECDDD